jgi:pyruvate carboxylase subunit B
MKYFVTVNNRDYQVEYDDSNPSEIQVNGKSVPFDFATGTHVENVSLILDHESLMFWIEREQEGYHAHCLGRDFNIMVEDEKSRKLKKILKAGGSKSVAGTVKASMPGMIVKIVVEPEQQVKKGDGLVIVEAMKMENEITSPLDGTVKVIKVAPQQAVEKGETLLTIEPAP